MLMHTESTTEKLLRAMEVVKSDDLDGHKLIWSFSSEHMKRDAVPPISALVYGTRRILFPDMHWESTPDLLEMFALAEIIRKQTLQDAKEGLEWDQYYRNGGKEAADGVQLTDQEREKIQSVVRKMGNENLRMIYRTVVMQLCWAHIHLIRRSQETYRILHFFRRYFPASTRLQQSEAPAHVPLWLSGFSESELVEYDTIRRRIKEFLQDVEEWEQEYLKDLPDDDDAYNEARMTPEYQTCFCDKFPLAVEWNNLANVTLRHLDKIQAMTSLLHSVFSDSNSASVVQVTAHGSGLSPILGKFPQKHEEVRVSLTSREDPRQFDRLEGGYNRNQHSEGKGSQESNGSSKLSYIDAPSDIGHAPPTSLLQHSQ